MHRKEIRSMTTDTVESKKFDFVVNLTTESYDDIINKVDEYLQFLDTKRYNIVKLARSLYILRKYEDRVKRYKEYRDNVKLSLDECNHLYHYIKDSVLKFLQKPVDGSNVYLYSPLVNKWIVISPHGYMWLIYGSAQKQIHLVGQYIAELIDEYETLIDLKNGLEFVNKIFIQLGYDSDGHILANTFKDEEFYTNYKKLIDMVEERGMRLRHGDLFSD